MLAHSPAFVINLLFWSVGSASTAHAQAAAHRVSQHAMTMDGVCLAQEAKLLADDGESTAIFGTSVSLDGDTALVGSSWWGDGLGAGYVFVRQGASWTQSARLPSPPTPTAFGASAALKGDRALVGALSDDGNQPYSGSVHVFVRTGTTWSLETKLVANDGHTNDRFGQAVAYDGGTAIVGAPAGQHPELGAASVYVFVRTGTSWTQQAKLVPHDGGFQDNFGSAVALSGDTALVGAYTRNGATAYEGAAYVFVRTGTTWTEQAKLVPPALSYYDFFGNSVALNGDTALIGALRDDDVAEDAGAVYAYVRSGDTWTLEEKLTTPVAVHFDEFGSSLSMSGERALVGAQMSHAHGERPGAAYLFERKSGAWTERAEFLADDGVHGDTFGRAVALDGDTAVIGAPFDGDHGFRSGSVYVFSLPLEVGSSYCTCPAGPCGNSDSDAGCANSTGVGASLGARGSTLPDELNLFVSGARPSQFGIFIQGDNAVMVPFGDGFRCTSGSVVRITRLPVQVESDGSVTYGPCFGDPLVSDTTGVQPGSGDTKRYQFWYRDPNGPCAGGFNLSNGLELVW